MEDAGCYSHIKTMETLPQKKTYWRQIANVIEPRLSSSLDRAGAQWLKSV